MPHLPDVFAEEVRNPLLKTQKITAATLGKYRPLLSGSADWALSGGRYLNFRTMPHLSAAFSADGINPRLETQKITASPLGESRAMLSESDDLCASRR